MPHTILTTANGKQIRITPLVDNQFLPAASENIEALEQFFSTQFPTAYKNLLTIYGGIHFEGYAIFDAVSYKYADRIKPNGSILNILYGYYEGDHYHDLIDHIDTYRNRMPIGRDGFGNQICLGIGGEEMGRVFFWDHEGEELFDDGIDNWENIYHVADSFDAFLNGLTLQYEEEEETE